jgi:tetratricopeptide (TPR) repeat protein
MNSDLVVLLSKGVEEATNGSKSRARTYFRQALTLDRNNETAMLWLAWLTDDPYEAVDILQQVVQRNPRNEVARAYLEQAIAKRNELDQLVSSSTSFGVWSRFNTPQTYQSNQKRDAVVPYLGEFLLRQGYITRQQLDAALRRHSELAQRGSPKLVGQILVELGFITQTQLEAGLQQQRGEYNLRFND